MMLLEARIRDGRYLVTHQPINYVDGEAHISFPNSVADDLGLSGNFCVSRKKDDFSEVVITPCDCSEKECNAHQENNQIKIKDDIPNKLPYGEGECVGMDIDLQKIEEDGILITRLDDHEIGDLRVVKRHDYIDVIQDSE